ncbi:MAG: DUF488 family protein [Steroidobacteraceae bacterium]|jgi:uncharacterized protein YeaO (DUF488 family)|nr:DUF488 family protein [Steroidobacteraceae bacterium]
MALRIVRLGSPRLAGEGTRIGTVRRPPRGVPRAEWSRRDWFDAWYPDLAPSAGLLREGRAASSEPQWRRFARRYRREMAAPAPRRAIALLAALSRHADLSVGCYCADESRCHRSILRELLAECGARLVRDRARPPRRRRAGAVPRAARVDSTSRRRYRGFVP